MAARENGLGGQEQMSPRAGIVMVCEPMKERRDSARCKQQDKGMRRGGGEVKVIKDMQTALCDQTIPAYSTLYSTHGECI